MKISKPINIYKLVDQIGSAHRYNINIQQYDIVTIHYSEHNIKIVYSDKTIKYISTENTGTILNQYFIGVENRMDKELNLLYNISTNESLIPESYVIKDDIPTETSYANHILIVSNLEDEKGKHMIWSTVTPPKLVIRIDKLLNNLLGITLSDEEKKFMKVKTLEEIVKSKNELFHIIRNAIMMMPFKLFIRKSKLFKMTKEDEINEDDEFKLQQFLSMMELNKNDFQIESKIKGFLFEIL